MGYFNQKTGMNLTSIFNQYFRDTAILTLDLKFNKADGTVAYRWKRYSQAKLMKLMMMREALAKLDRQANEHAASFSTASPN